MHGAKFAILDVSVIREDVTLRKVKAEKPKKANPEINEGKSGQVKPSGQGAGHAGHGQGLVLVLQHWRKDCVR
jgi:hypothetical protein